jgi:hypothetical protein
MRNRKGVERLVEALQAMLDGAVVIDEDGDQFRLLGDRGQFDVGDGDWVDWVSAMPMPSEHITWSTPRDPTKDPQVGDKFEDRSGDTIEIVGLFDGHVWAMDSGDGSGVPMTYGHDCATRFQWKVLERADG